MTKHTGPLRRVASVAATLVATAVIVAFFWAFAGNLADLLGYPYPPPAQTLWCGCGLYFAYRLLSARRAARG